MVYSFSIFIFTKNRKCREKYVWLSIFISSFRKWTPNFWKYWKQKKVIFIVFRMRQWQFCDFKAIDFFFLSSPFPCSLIPHSRLNPRCLRQRRLLPQCWAHHRLLRLPILNLGPPIEPSPSPPRPRCRWLGTNRLRTCTFLWIAGNLLVSPSLCDLFNPATFFFGAFLCCGCRRFHRCGGAKRMERLQRVLPLATVART